MLCIAVAPESRRLGKVDLFNAAPQCDLIEFRLDRLGKEPDLKEMMEGINKPILISCRRKADGGAWDGTEEERLVQLRTAIITGPAYVELELDVANQIPRFGNTKRVVLFDTLMEGSTPEEIEAVVAHELGHYRHRHILFGMLRGAVIAFVVLAASGWLSKQAWLLPSFGIAYRDDALALLACLLLNSIVGPLLAPLGNWISRRNEFQADDFARRHVAAAPMISALLKLSRAPVDRA